MKDYALPKAKAEATELQKLMDKEGKGEKLEAWDWWYYTEKLRKEKYNLSEEEANRLTNYEKSDKIQIVKRNAGYQKPVNIEQKRYLS